jgi:hypothetical protein
MHVGVNETGQHGALPCVPNGGIVKANDIALRDNRRDAFTVQHDRPKALSTVGQRQAGIDDGTPSLRWQQRSLPSVSETLRGIVPKAETL